MVKKLKKQYETPNRAWNQERMDKEAELSDKYGLANKEEIYKAYSELRSLRRQARRLVSEPDSEEAQEVIQKVHRLGLVKSNAQLEDLLTLQVEDILNRRLQTAVHRRGLADTPKQARQLVTHGHVYINGERVNIPGYTLTQEEEKQIEVEEFEESEEETEEQEEVDESEEAEEPEDEESEETEEGETKDE